MQSWGRRNSGDIPNPLPSLVNVLAITCTQSSCQRSWPFLVQGLSSLLIHCGHSGSYLSVNQGPERWRLYGVAGSTCQSPYPGLVGGHSSWNTSFVWPRLPTEAYLLSSNPTQEKRLSNLFLWELHRHPGPQAPDASTHRLTKPTRFLVIACYKALSGQRHKVLMPKTVRTLAWSWTLGAE